MNQIPQIEFKKPKTLDIDLVKANPFYVEEKPSCITYTSKFKSKICFESSKICTFLITYAIDKQGEKKAVSKLEYGR